MSAQTIDQVIQHLDDIIGWSLSNNSRLGYFAALIDGVENELAEIWPVLRLLDHFAGRAETRFFTGSPP